jgi:ribosomal protein S27E
MFCRECGSLYLFRFDHGITKTSICLVCGKVINKNKGIEAMKNISQFILSKILGQLPHKL